MLFRSADEEGGPPPGTRGTVTSTFSFDQDTMNYGVKWDDGSRLNLLNDVDTYMLEDDFPKGQIAEAHWTDDATEISQNFKFGILRKFLNRLRESGVVNMFGASPYLYMGREKIDSKHRYDVDDDNEAYEEMLELADKVKDEMIRGVIKDLQSRNKEVTVEEVNRMIGKWANKILHFHFRLH